MNKSYAKANKISEFEFDSLTTLKNLQTPSTKIQNWNVISEIFQNFKIVINSNAKSLILSGDI